MDTQATTLALDTAVFDLIQKEKARQTHGIELIASENYVSEQVMRAQGSILTNKYAEGLPGKRYYGGCEIVDQIEQLAIDRAKELFGVEWVNVQPHSGAQANAAVMLAILNPGDKILGFDLSHGGEATAERIAADQRRTSRRHTGPITLVVEERGIGRARLLRIDGTVTTAQASQRPLCGAEVSAGACRPGEPVTGVEITYHLGALPSGTAIAVQDTSAVLPARTLGAEIVLQ